MLKKLRKKLGKGKEDKPQRLGLHPISTNPQRSNVVERYPVDIIAVHGLNGNAYSTWEHENGTLWLRDLLPKSLPGCRVFTYGYPSKVFGNSSLAEVKDYSRRLLSDIRGIREGSSEEIRPIIFVCHSLGGIVCKQALVYAHEDDEIYGDILRATTGVVFLGTPHRGSNLATIGSIVGKIINIGNLGLGGAIVKTNLLDSISYDSRSLQDLEVSVRNRLHDLAVVSFYETQTMPKLSTLIVDMHSSVLGIPHEDITPLYENHRGLCRFAGETPSYKAVSRALRNIVDSPHTKSRLSKRVSTTSSQRTLSEAEKSCMALLSGFDVADYKRLLPRPSEGTCAWILQHESFVPWLQKRGHSILWLTGYPGCGKTMLSFFLADYLELAPKSREQHTVCVYFCDDKISKQKDGKAILIGLIFQMVCRHRSLVRHVKKEFELRGLAIVQSFSVLWTIFENTVNDPKSGPVYIIVDALDECEKETGRQFLDAISKLVQAPEHTVSSGKGVKVLLTSRPWLRDAKAGGDAINGCSRICIDEGQAGYNQDLQVYIHHRVHQFAETRNLPTDLREFLEQTLQLKAGHTFLWIHMVLTSLENSLLTSKSAFQEVITKVPADLKITYFKLLSAVPTGHQDIALRFLKLVLGSVRLLSLDEINIAFTIRSHHKTTEEVAANLQAAISHTLQGVLGPLIRLTESRVTLVHQSAKEYILQDGNADRSTLFIRGIDAANSALLLSSACIHYLLLEDFSTDIFARNRPSLESTYPAPASPDGEISPVASYTGGFWAEDEWGLDSVDMFKESDALDPELCKSISLNHRFYRYASLHWAAHFELCEELASPALRSAARRLLDTKNTNSSNWLRFFSVERPAVDRNINTSLSPLSLAAYFNLHSTLLGLLNEEDEGQHSSKNGDEALFWACEAGHGRNVEELLRAGAEPNVHVSDGHTPLATAAWNGHLGCVMALLADNRTDMNVGGTAGRSALAFASSNGYLDIVEYLLRQDDCNVNQVDNSCATALIWATRCGHVPIVSALLKHPKVDVNHRDRSGRTAASWAARIGMKGVLKKLLTVPVTDVNLEDCDGRSPLSWAAGNGCTSTVQVLVQNERVNKSSLDKDGRSAISWACGGGHAETLRTLLKYGCEGVVDKDVDGWNPLAWAIEKDSTDTIEVLVSTRLINLEEGDDSMKTALWWAVEYGHFKVVQKLLEEGANPKTSDKSGRTPLSLAKSRGRLDMAEELMVYIEKAGAGE